jgi:hypothetical protein
LEYNPQFSLQQGLKEAIDWYWNNLSRLFMGVKHFYEIACCRIEIKKEKLKNRDIIVKDLRIRKLKRQKNDKTNWQSSLSLMTNGSGARNGV